MNSLNHFVFSMFLCLIVVELTKANLFYAALFSLIFAVLIDLDHLLYFHFKEVKKHNREELELLRNNTHMGPYPELHTWIQEPMGLILLGVPIALIVSAINKDFFLLTILAYSSHIFLDYLCVFPARPLEPFSNKEYKKLGHGIFYPHYPKKWRDFVEKNKIRASDELIFGVLILILLVILVIFKGGILV